MTAALRLAVMTALAGAVLVAVPLGSGALGDLGLRADFTARNLPPSWARPLGTDRMGRDLAARVVHGLTLSLQVGLLAAGLSTAIALVVALVSSLGRAADAAMGFLTDVMLALPHLLLLLLISFALGGGVTAVIIAVAISHWPRLARLLRAEIRQVRSAPFVEASRAFGRSRLFVARHHILPLLLPQLLTGYVLMFPHAILHEAALTFLGFGLEPSRPAIGVMLSEAMRHIGAGRWWLAVGPGAALVMLVLCLERVGDALHRRTNPRELRL
ncbi:ABC transporter permease [Paracoccus nototheniae]|uniref:ABC transporter permease n=1 Tax=Paracoccus nototheniae TaxID=2489002 RepID=A0ABW4E0A3_9RHOB|nr:ABC transporter permease [Paracoccus nototheniae]